LVALEQNFACRTFNGKGRDIGLGMPRIAKHHFYLRPTSIWNTHSSVLSKIP
jgi:hypothetical protein